MAKPTDVRSVSPEAADAIANAISVIDPNLTQAQVEAAVTAALLAVEPLDVNVVNGSSSPFTTGEEAIPANTVTQLPSVPTPNGVLIRGDEDLDIYSTNAGTDGFRLYEGDDIKLSSVTNLDQVFVQTVKNQALTLWWVTL